MWLLAPDVAATLFVVPVVAAIYLLLISIAGFIHPRGSIGRLIAPYCLTGGLAIAGSLVAALLILNIMRWQHPMSEPVENAEVIST